MDAENLSSKILRISQSSFVECPLPALTDESIHSDVRQFFGHCLTDRNYAASNMTVFSASRLEEELAEGAAPGSLLAPFGYAPIAGSVGGNMIVVELISGFVYWADGEGLCSESEIDYEVRTLDDPKTGVWKSVEWSSESLKLALVLLSENLIEFMDALLDGEWKDRLNRLD